jgi:hypothetical protein
MEQSRETQKFFNRNPDLVAEDLLERELQVGSFKLTITGVLPEHREDNVRWEDRPLFTDPDVSAYVNPGYRGSHLMFLRTQPSTCVRIFSGITRSGEVLNNGGQVCRALGLDRERLGSVALQDSGLIKVQWRR